MQLNVLKADVHINILAIKLADAAAPLDGAGAGLFAPNTLSILLISSSTVFVMLVTISIGAPFFPMKNNDGNGTNLSADEKQTIPINQ